MSFTHLKPLILDILRAPDVDLASISAKRVRKTLGEQRPELDIKEHKSEIDAIIIEAFHEISPTEDDTPASTPVNGSTSAPSKRKRSPSPVVAAPSSPAPAMAVASSSKPPKVLASKPKAVPEVRVKADPTALTDEELARKLHEEWNAPGRSTRAGTGYAPTRRGGGGGSKNKKTKSNAYVDDSDVEGEDSGAQNGTSIPKKRVKRERDPNKPATGAFHKPWALSDALAEVVGEKEMSRPQVIKQLWAYIREHNLQDEKDRRNIICDEKLRAIFGTAKTNAFKMNKPLQKHFLRIDVESAASASKASKSAEFVESDEDHDEEEEEEEEESVGSEDDKAEEG